MCWWAVLRGFRGEYWYLLLPPWVFGTMVCMDPSGFKLLYEDGPCLVVGKPGGVLTQAPPGIDSLEVRVKDFLCQRANQSGNVYLGVPHRIDRPASGALLLAKNSRAARRLGEQFQARRIAKQYLALTENVISEEEGTWSDWVRKIPDVARAELCAESDAGSRHALLHFRVLARLDTVTLAEITLETGRTHQIRLQASSRGFPLLGDTLYGAQTMFGPVSEDPRDRWIALHARRLQFAHPMTRQSVTVVAPLPTCWKEHCQFSPWLVQEGDGI